MLSLIHSVLLTTLGVPAPQAEQGRAEADSGSAGRSQLPTTYYFGQARTHELEPGVLLVRIEEVADLGAALARAGIDGASSEPLPYPGWILLRTGDALNDPRAVRERVDALLAGPEASYVAPVMTGELTGTWFAPMPELLLEFTAGASPAEIEAALASVPIGGSEAPMPVGTSRSYRIALSSRNGFEVLEAANRLAPRAELLYAEPNMILTGRHGQTPNDPLYPSQWGIDNTGQTGGTPGIDLDGDIAWEGFPPGITPEVLIIDDGVQLDHPDMAGKISGSADFSTGTTLPGGGPVNACDRHGTAVAGCVAAVRNNGIGVAGLASNAMIRSARCFIANVPCDGSWTTQTNSTVLALDWAELFGVLVTNNSNGYGFSSSAIAGKYASTKTGGMIHFASAGNNSGGSVTYPATLPSVHAVSAIDHDGLLASFSSVGAAVEFTGPGVSIPTTDRTGSDGYVSGDYVFVNGTSFASPLVAAVAAQHITYHSLIGFPATIPTPTQTETVMRNGAVDLGAPGKDTSFGWGLPSAAEAVLPDGYDSFGTGTPGCEGPLTFNAYGSSGLGHFTQFFCSHAPPLATGYNGISLGQSTFVLGGATFLIDPNASLLIQTVAVTSNADGDATLSLIVPNDPNLIGLSVYSQWFWSAVGTPCYTGSIDWSTSNGQTITILP